MPIVAVVSIFNGSIDIDTDKLNESIQENISAEQIENLQLINDTMTEVENQLKSKMLSDCNIQAEVIYLFSLTDKSEDENFVKNFVSCFKKNWSDEDLIKVVNQKFGTEIKYDEFQKMMQSIKGAEISTAGFTDKTTKNNLDLVKWCENGFPTPDKMLLGFDILVTDTPEREEWICYDTLSDEIKLSPRSIEQSMFDILNREVKEYGLSYTECNYEVINGKSIMTYQILF